ncbi:hypothetical protein FE257_010909 [Aspergillus nanangensis]|uniref:Xylanolytic transcriptional activator regulatory domain-containing protein n=1 Tax=Aspergillus nanangensis TaxID=2582783 RepID=A0AAD4CXN0_ASPNN|nr:hypothetical protein FE257_010909 [Aspergillus nanangensis]
MKRGEAQSCTFVGRGPKGRTAQGRSSPSHVQDRVQHLENLILSLVQRKELEETYTTSVSRDDPNVAPQSSRQSIQETSPSTTTVISDAKGSPFDPSSKLLVGEAGTSYIDGAHWSAILEEYNEFWVNPENASLASLALLYAILTLVASTYQRLGEPLPSTLEDTASVIRTFRKRAAQCLAQSNYTIPGQRKVEALFVYTMGEFYRTNDAQVSVSFLLSLTIRLALRTGYHRDPRHFPAISPFVGEMRRRMWAILKQLDTLISFQVGLPRTIQDWQHDVEMPRNLSDEDFGEETQVLPPPRPDAEYTRTSYVRTKGAVMSIFGKISDLAYSWESMTYEETLEIDRHLEEAHDLFPEVFRVKPIEQSITDSSELILQRYTLAILYQKSRCVLHRKYLGEAHNTIRYAYSRWACLSASKAILHHQADLHNETQPGGILYRDRIFPNSLQYADYLLASMIICLELSYGNGNEDRRDQPKNGIAVVIEGREDLLATLQTSHRIFETSRRQSTDAQKAYAALTIMLQRAQRGLLYSARTSEQPALHDKTVVPAQTPPVQPPPYGSWQRTDDPSYTHQTMNPGMTSQTNPAEPSFASLASPLFNVIASVESYEEFLPFLTASTVTARDPETRLPTRAFLTVGYGPLSETFTSRVDCDRSRWIVEARSGAKFGVDSKDGQDASMFPGANEVIFEYLSTRWELTPGEGAAQSKSTKVELQIRFEFRNQLHAAMMSAVEGQMAGVMIEAFEKRIREVVRS